MLAVCVLAGIGVRAYKAVVLSSLFGLITVFVWVLIVVPVVVGFGLSLASAVAWCIWLEGSRTSAMMMIRQPPSARAVVSNASAS